MTHKPTAETRYPYESENSPEMLDARRRRDEWFRQFGMDELTDG